MKGSEVNSSKISNASEREVKCLVYVADLCYKLIPQMTDLTKTSFFQ